MATSSIHVKKRLSTFPDPAFPFEIVHVNEPANNMGAFHWHDYMELSFVEKGRGTYEVEDRTFDVETGDIVVLNNIQRHRVTYLPVHRLHETVLHFAPEILWSGRRGEFDGRYAGLFDHRGAAFVNKPDLTVAARREISALIHSITDEFTRRLPQYRLMIKARLLTLIALILRHSDPQPCTGSEVTLRRRNIDRLDRITTFIREHSTDESVTLQTVARQFRLNPSYFSDYFKKNLGQGFHDYLTNARVNNAIRLLKENRISAGRIAFAAGFSSAASFFAAFRRITGTTPAKYREM